ncbi:MAG TPA: putative toxin-antitoxin system toxin component, PIN family [Terracidiphilus sp.]|jgi:putative PIN family toxin of toxin-antitoxin system|nr:putative toxin-antitoxin system toxin component, PIN family [Terracidiphilus sp.]
MEYLAKPRVVLDTNVYVSALLFGGKPGRVVRLAEWGAFTLLISAPLRAEVEDVLARKFGYARAMIRKACEPIWNIAERIEPAFRVDLCRDPADNRVLECAITGEAHCIVTGDRDLLDLPAVTAYRILRPEEFLQAMDAAG